MGARSPARRRPSSGSTSSAARSRPMSLRNSPGAAVDEVAPVETLVNHLLLAKRSLSSVTLVLRANELATHARLLHEETVVHAAQTAYLQRAVHCQALILQRVRKGLLRAYDSGKREFKHILKTLDAANARLEKTMAMLRATVVDRAFRPPDEEPRSLLDFVDEKSVGKLRNSIKESIDELQAAQKSFDSDILRFDTDLRNLKNALNPPADLARSRASLPDQSMHKLLFSIAGHSHYMAQLLTSLTRHFDLCVTAVRSTEGGAALARRRAAEATQQQPQGGESVSISGVIDEQDEFADDLSPITGEDRAEMLQVLVQDAAEVDDVVREIQERLGSIEDEFSALRAKADAGRAAYRSTLAAFRILDEVGSRLASYMTAEAEFLERWHGEKVTISARLDDMDGLRSFYQGYASAYDSLILEADRRRAVEAKTDAVWRRAKESVDRLAESDREAREAFRRAVGDYLPTDLWAGMSDPMRAWDLVLAPSGSAPRTEPGPAVDQGAVEKARERLRRQASAR